MQHDVVVENGKDYLRLLKVFALKKNRKPFTKQLKDKAESRSCARSAGVGKYYIVSVQQGNSIRGHEKQESICIKWFDCHLNKNKTNSVTWEQAVFLEYEKTGGNQR